MHYTFCKCFSFLMFSHFCSLAYESVSEVATWLLGKTKHRPKIAIICGSGLGKIKRYKKIEQKVEKIDRSGCCVVRDVK